ncbi:hypothetical protein BU14_0209s0007 [Porphyra umbilicalis]|uniref:Malectin domain-containing protein n=1 Tax=Porphyra umbilicalis TaxID=2786 RepID=A0A1X6P5I4_PORUM|nr:hypothetical protein BU14_0209s0007 [Porphyra umbilicalis]|eukprot:OSX76015.1 hypothetical protein BU14_0209s0007 [Porphyra umbilicalis]
MVRVAAAAAAAVVVVAAVASAAAAQPPPQSPPPPPPPATFTPVWTLNCGGGAIAANASSDGRAYAADAHHVGDTVGWSRAPHPLPPQHRTLRYARSGALVYALPVPAPGYYRVAATWVELFQTRAGARRLWVGVGGDVVPAAPDWYEGLAVDPSATVDVWAAAGGSQTVPVTRVYPAEAGAGGPVAVWADAWVAVAVFSGADSPTALPMLGTLQLQRGVAAMTMTPMPTPLPSAMPTAMATVMPTAMATAMPTTMATAMPTAMATAMPTAMATAMPTAMATAMPTDAAMTPAATPPAPPPMPTPTPAATSVVIDYSTPPPSPPPTSAAAPPPPPPRHRRRRRRTRRSTISAQSSPPRPLRSTCRRSRSAAPPAPWRPPRRSAR